MDFRCNNPGAVQFGNFINYYQFNSAEERLQLLPKDEYYWTCKSSVNNTDNDKSSSYVVLDIGCNSGVVTQLIYNFLKNELKIMNIKILGIDIDSTLIERAKKTNISPADIKYECLDIMDPSSLQILLDFLNSYNKTKYDAILCLSITMWIHLNHRDDGLMRFLQACTRLTNLLVIEPQPWKCYQTAIRRMKKADSTFPNFHELKWRSNIEKKIENYLETDLNQEKIYESSATKWGRKICFYRHKEKNSR